MNEPSQHEEATLQAALKLPPKERAAYLDQACGGDEELRVAKNQIENPLDAIGADNRKDGYGHQFAGGVSLQPIASLQSASGHDAIVRQTERLRFRR